MAGALDGASQYTLMPGTGARLPARSDLAFVRDEAPEHIALLVVDAHGLICTKLAGFRAGKVTALSRTRAAAFASRVVSFFRQPFFTPS